MQGLDVSQPFVLLDDARATGAADARLFTRPRAIISAHSFDQVKPALEQLRLAASRGRTAAGFISYEASFALEDRLHPISQRPDDGLPLLWMGLFDSVDIISAGDVPDHLPDPAGAWIDTPQPDISYAEYQAMADRVQALIAAGDIYQANLTFSASVRTHGDPLAVYARLRATSQAGWGGIVHTGRQWILSASPELFFTIADRRITARPMKGTARRGSDPQSDARAIDELRADTKERAENLMIVDLIRNDLSRVAVPGSVRSPSLFDVESYPTIHQLTSTVTAELDRERDIIDVIEALFPCGSVTGAPKIRAMEVIADVEKRPRGLYTGSIGWIGPDAQAAFNVAIRTLVLPEEPGPARLGLGSGLVADSRAESEWRECLAKGAFASAGNRAFDLIETMRFDPITGIEHLHLHMQRLEASARGFGFAFNRHDIRNELQAAVFALRQPMRVRLLLSRTGAVSIESSPLPAAPAEPVLVKLAPLPVAPGDFRLRHKTTARSFYDDARKAAGSFEVVFIDPEQRLTEGSFTSVFVERNGLLHTPALSRGLLPGVLRQSLIDEGRATEAELTAADLAGGFFIGNALRGLMRAQLVAAAGPAGL